MAPRTYEEWQGTRFRTEHSYADRIEDIIRDAPLRLPSRKAWQLYMSPEMQNFREMKMMNEQEEGHANQRLAQEELREAQRVAAPGDAMDLSIVANAANRMAGAASAVEQMAQRLEQGHQAHAAGIAAESRAEMDKLAQEIRAEHERSRIAREVQASLADHLAAEVARIREATAQASSSMDVEPPAATTSTTNEQMEAMQRNLAQQTEGIKELAAEMMRENRDMFARMAAQQGLTAAEMQKTLEQVIARQQPTIVDARAVNIDARSVDARSVNVEARSVNVDARTVAVDARSATVQQMVDSYFRAQACLRAHQSCKAAPT